MRRLDAAGQVVLVGLSHHTAPLAVREPLASVNLAAMRAALGLPCVLVSTCNRVEVYAWEDAATGRLDGRLLGALASSSGVGRTALRPHVFVKRGYEALLHLVRVACGLDSLVLGEDQVRGQIKSAVVAARALGDLPAALDGGFNRALDGSRRVRGSGFMGRHPSVATVGVEVALHSPDIGGWHGIRGTTAVVLGAGVMAKAAAQTLLARGAHLVLANRTAAHATQVADGLPHRDQVVVEPLSGLEALLANDAVVLVVGSTASPRPVVLESTVRAAVQRRTRPLVLVDLAVPRDVEPSVRGIDGVRLIDMDDLDQLCPADGAARMREMERMEALAREAADEVDCWLRARVAAPAIVELRRRADLIRQAELKRTAARLASLTPEQQAAVDALTRALVGKLVHGPTVALRDAALVGGAPPDPALLDLVPRPGVRRRRGGVASRRVSA